MDGTVGVKQAPDADRLIDNEVRTNGNGDTVYRQKVAAALIDSAGDPTGTNSNPVHVDIRNLDSSTDSVEVADATSRDLTHVVATVTASGDTTIHTPASGKKVRLHWIYAVSDPDSSDSPLISVWLGDTGTAANEKYRAYALSKRQVVTGPTDGALIVSLDGLGNVAVTALIEEIDP